MEIKQAKEQMDIPGTGPVVIRLLDRQAPSLADWYGDPVSKDTAQSLAAIAQNELHARLCEGSDCFQLHVLLMICNFWMGASIAMDYEQLTASTSDERERALLELVYGQLLISCKYRQAPRHLGKGFSLAVDFLDASDYFRIVRQHELLDYLPVSSTPAEPLELESLLTEAGVIKRMQAGAGKSHVSAHLDTVG